LPIATLFIIADNIGVNKSTISQELARNTGKRSYRHKQGNGQWAMGNGQKKSLLLEIS
jgi:IS30 family transposase